MGDGRRRAGRGLVIIFLLLGAGPLAGQQGTPSAPVPQGTPQGTPAPQSPSRPARRTVEIRGQAPAPEVITVRPRELPRYARRLVAPYPYDGGEGATAPAPIVLLPGGWSPGRAVTQDSRPAPAKP